jgi:hypothetical protein
MWRGQKFYFEGEWMCGDECLRQAVAGALRREVGDTALRSPGQMGVGPHRHRVPLGLVLLAQGWITHPQLQQALEAQRRTGQGRIGGWLQAECGLEERQVTRALSMQWSCPVLGVEGFEPAKMAQMVPRAFVERLRLLPLRLTGNAAAGSGRLYLAFEEHLDAAAEFALERMLEVKVESGLIDGTAFELAHRRLMESRFNAETVRVVKEFDEVVAAAVEAIEQARPAESRLVRLHGFYWLRMWLSRGDTEDLIFKMG